MDDYVEIVPHSQGIINRLSLRGMNGFKLSMKTNLHSTLLRIFFEDTEESVDIIWSQHNISFNFDGSPSKPHNIENFCGGWHEFWCTWFGKMISVGQAGSDVPILTANLPHKKVDNLVPSRQSWWKFELPVFAPKSKDVIKLEGGEPRWVPVEGNVPLDAAVGGHENEPLVVARFRYRGSLTPGNYTRSKQAAYIAWGGQAREETKHFEVLVGYNFKWVPCESGRITTGAVVGGYSEVDDEPLYIGRVHTEGHLLLGKVQMSHRVCYVPQTGREIAYEQYEVLATDGDSRITIEPADDLRPAYARGNIGLNNAQQMALGHFNRDDLDDFYELDSDEDSDAEYDHDHYDVDE